MYQQEKITPLLEAIVEDNTTYKFPFQFISKELVNMFLNRLEFDYFSIQCYRKLKREYGGTIAHIFLTVLDIKLKLKERDIYSISDDEYYQEIENLFITLENLFVTRIEKDSPDGELMSAMAE